MIDGKTKTSIIGHDQTIVSVRKEFNSFIGWGDFIYNWGQPIPSERQVISFEWNDETLRLYWIAKESEHRTIKLTIVHCVREQDEADICKFLRPHWLNIKNAWTPFAEEY